MKKKRLLFIIIALLGLTACHKDKEPELDVTLPSLEVVQPTEAANPFPEGGSGRETASAVFIGEAETGPDLVIAYEADEESTEMDARTSVSTQEAVPSDGFQEAEGLTEEGSDDPGSSEASDIPEASEYADPSGIPETSQAIETSENIEDTSGMETASPTGEGSVLAEYPTEGAGSAEESIPSSIRLGDGNYSMDDEQFEEIQDIYRAQVESMEQDEELRELMREAAANMKW